MTDYPDFDVTVDFDGAWARRPYKATLIENGLPKLFVRGATPERALCALVVELARSRHYVLSATSDG